MAKCLNTGVTGSCPDVPLHRYTNKSKQQTMQMQYLENKENPLWTRTPGQNQLLCIRPQHKLSEYYTIKYYLMLQKVRSYENNAGNLFFNWIIWSKLNAMKCKYEQNILAEAEKRPRTSTLLTAGTCTLISPLAFVANLLGSVSSLNKNNVNLISLSLAYFLYDHFYNAASP